MRPESLATLRLSILSLRVMQSSIKEEGLEWEPLLAAAEIPQSVADDLNGEISGVQELRLQEAFAHATHPIPGVWLRTGLGFPP